MAPPRLRTTHLLLFIAIYVCCSTGCLLPTPIAVFPAPEFASGMKLTFCDDLGQRISEDGLLIVSRRYDLPVYFSANRLVPITDGTAAIPEQWVLASVWLMPNMFSLYLIPCPYVHPGGNLEIIPILPKWNYEAAAESQGSLVGGRRTCPISVPPYRYSNGQVWLSPSTDPEKGIEYLERVLEHVHRPKAKAITPDLPDLCLSPDDHAKLTTLARREIERLRNLRRTETQPASEPYGQ